MTEQQANALLRKAVKAWGGKDRVRDCVIGTLGEDVSEDVAVIDHAMGFVQNWLYFVESQVNDK